MPASASKRTISLLGVTRNTDNYGVRVLLSAAVEALTRAFPTHEITALDYGKTPEVWIEHLLNGRKDVALINLRFSWRLYLPNNGFRLLFYILLTKLLPRNLRHWLWARNTWLRKIREADINFSISGGDSFSDIYGIRRFTYVALPQLLVLLMERPLVQLPQTYGPFRTRFARVVARYILLHSQVLFSRDEAGSHTISSLLKQTSPAVWVVPDIGFAMSTEPLTANIEHSICNIRNRGTTVGLNVSSLLYIGGYSGTNMFGLKIPFPALVDTLIAYLIQQAQAQVLLVPHVVGGPASQEDETRLCAKLYRQLQSRYGTHITYLDSHLTHRQTKELIGRCDLFVGARMHACVAAVSQGVPSVCLAYSGKFAGVMAPFGKGAQVVDLRHMSITEVLETTQEVLNNRAQLQSDLQHHLEHLPDFSAVLQSHFASRDTHSQELAPR